MNVSVDNLVGGAAAIHRATVTPSDGGLSSRHPRFHRVCSDSN